MKRPHTKVVVAALLAVAGVIVMLWFIANRPRTRPTFDTVTKLHDGQTYDQVMAILGKPDCTRFNESPGDSDTIEAWWSWSGPSAPPPPDPDLIVIIVTFKNGLARNIEIIGMDPPDGKAATPKRLN